MNRKSLTPSEPISSDTMRALEEEAIASGRVTGLELMERAGAGVVEAIYEHWPELENGIPPEQWSEAFADDREDAAHPPLRAVVLCGPGNNGGDGFVVARLLRTKGWEVEVFFYGNRARLSADAAANYDAWAEGNAVLQLGFPDLAKADLQLFWDKTRGLTGTFLIVDALFGLGLNRPLTALQPILEEIEHNQFSRMEPVPIFAPRCVAIDMASGVNSDTGKAPLVEAPLYYLAVYADLTVTFHREKLGHRLGNASHLCGTVVVKDIGL